MPPGINRTYRNPIYLDREYKRMIDSREVKNYVELARMKGISKNKSDSNSEFMREQDRWSSNIW